MPLSGRIVLRRIGAGSLLADTGDINRVVFLPPGAFSDVAGRDRARLIGLNWVPLFPDGAILAIIDGREVLVVSDLACEVNHGFLLGEGGLEALLLYRVLPEVALAQDLVQHGRFPDRGLHIIVLN